MEEYFACFLLIRIDICIVCLYFEVFLSLRFYCKPLTIFGKLILSSVLRISPIAVQGVVVYVVKQLLEDVSGYKVQKKIGEI